MRRVWLLLSLLPTLAVAAGQAPTPTLKSPIITGGSASGMNVSGAMVIPTGGVGSQTLANLAAGYRYGTGTSGSYDALINVVGGGAVALGGILQYQASLQQFLAYDFGQQFGIGQQPGATQYWSAEGTANQGAVFYATNGNAASGGAVNGNFVTQNAGSFFFATGTGVAFTIADAGAAATNNLVITPGTTTANPKLSSSVSVQIDASAGSTTAGSGYGTVLSYGGVTQALVAPIGGGVPSTGYIQFGGSSGDSMAHISCLGASNTSCYIQAGGTGVVVFANAEGSFATFTNSVANTIVDSLLLRASSSQQPVIVTAGNGASVGIGTPSLPANSTKGFAGIPTCAAAPTGTPTQTSGWGYTCYNSASHNLNIYDPVAASWYHVALTAGAN